jgi:hypothetical protein
MSEPTTPSLRESLEAALQDPATEVEHIEAAPAPEPEVEVEASAEAPTSEGTEAPNLDELSEQEDASRERDENGRFKAKETQPQDQGMQPGPKPGPKIDKAPASWRPDVREHWGQLPEQVRSEIARRETEHARFIQETSEARKTAEAISQVVQPYMHFIKAENSNPIQAIDNLMSTAARLRTGTAPELASLVAGLVNQFGVGRFGNQFIEQLDAALAGQQPQVDPQTSQVQQVIQQQLAPVQQFMSRFQQFEAQRQQQATMQAQNEVQRFIGEAEFGEDVREDMADIIEMAQKRGQTVTLQQAYERACLMNDRVAKVIQQRRMAQGAQQQSSVAQKAKAAAVSVSGSAPMGALRQEPTDIRSAIEAAIAMNSR